MVGTVRGAWPIMAIDEFEVRRVCTECGEDFNVSGDHWVKSQADIHQGPCLALMIVGGTYENNSVNSTASCIIQA